MGTTKSKRQHKVAIDDQIDTKVLEKPQLLPNEISMKSDQTNSTKILTNRSEFKLLDVRSHSRLSRGSKGSRGSRGSSFHNSGKVYSDAKDDDKDAHPMGNNANKLMIPSANDSARMDIDTMIITIPASSLDSPSLHGKGLTLVSPMNSARRDSSISPVNSFHVQPCSFTPIQSPPATSRRNTLDGKPINLPTIHSALNFDVLLNHVDDDYGVGFFDTSFGKHSGKQTTTVAAY